MSEFMSAWDKRCADKHAEEKAAGLHDRFCEYMHRPGYYICHCRYRARMVAGKTAPLAHLEFPPPMCPGCDEDTYFDGDGFSCDACHASWSSDGTWNAYSDFYGDDLPRVVDGVLQETAVTP